MQGSIHIRDLRIRTYITSFWLHLKHMEQTPITTHVVCWCLVLGTNFWQYWNHGPDDTYNITIPQSIAIPTTIRSLMIHFIYLCWRGCHCQSGHTDVRTTTREARFNHPNPYAVLTLPVVHITIECCNTFSRYVKWHESIGIAQHYWCNDLNIRSATTY